MTRYLIYNNGKSSVLTGNPEFYSVAVPIDDATFDEDNYDCYDIQENSYSLNLEKVREKQLKEYSKNRLEQLEEIRKEAIDLLIDGKKIDHLKEKKEKIMTGT